MTVFNRLKTLLNHPYTRLGFRLFLAVMFLWSGLDKLLHPDMFLKAAMAYEVLPADLTKLYAALLPWGEVLSGGYLLVGFLSRYATGAITLMMLSFMVAISIVLLRGGEVDDCGCSLFGMSEPVSVKKLVEDLLILGMSVWLTLKPSLKFSLDGLFNKS